MKECVQLYILQIDFDNLNFFWVLSKNKSANETQTYVESTCS